MDRVDSENFVQKNRTRNESYDQIITYNLPL